jgi:hypothetical protein
MYTPQTEPVPTIDIPGPILNYPVISFFRSIIQPYARALRFSEPVMLHPERMVEAYRAFKEKRIRLIIGFRHAYGDDPQAMAYAIHHALPRAAKRIGKPLKFVTHAHFVYGVEVPLWSGKFVRWLLPNVGAVPINHVHMDSEGMNRIRKTILSGEFPLALAPEGHVTYASETVGELETGTARFGFWCIEDLAKQNRNETVVFLPVSIHYRYGKNAEKKLASFIDELESSCGINASTGKGAPSGNRRKTGKADPMPALRTRLVSVGKAMLENMAVYYSEVSGHPVGDSREALLGEALLAAERILALKAEGSTNDRIYRIRATAWDRIFRGDTESMTPLRKNLAGRETGEAWYAMRHLETAMMLVHVDFASVPDGADVHQCFEIANNLYDMIERLKGGTLRDRANVIDKKAVFVPGEPIVINDFYPLYREDRKAALTAATRGMREGFETCVQEYKAQYRKA